MSARRQPPPIADDNPPSPPRREPPPEPQQSTVEAVEVGEGQDSLASTLADGAAVDTARMISGLVRLRRQPVDPMTDYVGNGTRLPRFIRDAIAHEAAMTPRSAQEIQRDALLGVRPLSTELLDAHYLDLYGHEREH